MSGSTVLATAPSGTPGTTSTTFTISSTTVPVGVYATNTITAVYSPGTGFSGSTSSATTSSLTITGTNTTTAAPTFTPTTVTVGQAVSFSAVVTASSGTTAPTAGSVVFENGSTVLATATSVASSNSTSATFTASSSSIPLGSYSTITAVYMPGAGFNTSTSSASPTTLTVTPVTIPVGAIAQWTFENDAIALNNSPAPSTGAGTATPLGMTNSFNGTTSTNTDDVLLGASGDTGSNGLADTTQIWRVRGQTPGNGWSSQAPIGTQGAVFATSTARIAGPINVSFDWYATTQGEANLQLEYTTNGSTWINVPIVVPAGDADVVAKTNSSSANTVTGSYVQMSGGQQWAPGLTATISDPAAANNPNFAIELVNASTGADDIAAAGTPLNNTSGNWRFDNIDIAAPQAYTPGDLVVLQVGAGNSTYQQAPVSLNEVNANQTNQVAISGTTADALGNVTVTTTGTQTFTAGQWVQISGVQLGTNTTNAYNGVYSILTVNNAGNTFTYFNQLAGGLAAGTPATNGAWASNVVQQDAIPDTAGTGTTGISAVSGTGTATATVTTSTTALYGVGESLTFSGITPSAWDNTFTVASVLSLTQFTIT